MPSSQQKYLLREAFPFELVEQFSPPSFIEHGFYRYIVVIAR
jgi:hypothetical protein